MAAQSRVGGDRLGPGHIPATYKIAHGLLPPDVESSFEDPSGLVSAVELAELEAGPLIVGSLPCAQARSARSRKLLAAIRPGIASPG